MKPLVLLISALISLIPLPAESQNANPPPPELTALKGTFEKEIMRVQKPIKAQYVAKLTDLLQSAASDDNLDAVISIQNEVNLVKESGPQTAGGKEGPELIKERIKYRSDLKSATDTVADRYKGALENLQSTYTKAAKVNAALAVRHELARLAATAGNPSADTSPASAQPTTAEIDPFNPGASVTVKTSTPFKIHPLKVGEPRLYDSNPLRVIEGVDPALVGLQFTSIPQRQINTFEVTVNRPGVLYAFGAYKDNMTPEQFLGTEAARWQPAEGMIKGKNIWACFKRDVKQGEVIQLKSFELEIAAADIVKK